MDITRPAFNHRLWCACDDRVGVLPEASMTTVILYGETSSGITRLANRLVNDFELTFVVHNWKPWGALETGCLHVTDLDIDHLTHWFARRDDNLQPILIFEISALKTLLGYQQ